MIHFLVNNDYQLFDARRHAVELRGAGVAASLIEVPHALREERRGQDFVAVTAFASPLTRHRWLPAWRRYFAAARAVDAALRPAPGDVLFLYTEFELLNHFVVHRFKRANARVYLIEDGGVGTYLPFSLPSDEPLSLREWVIAAMTRRLPGLSRTRFHKVNGIVFPWLEDRCLDGLCTYRPLQVIRDLRVHLLPATHRSRIATQRGRVVFLNERMYDDYQTPEQYLVGLTHLVDGLVQGFDEVYFKFHPREEAAWTARIRQLLAQRHRTLRFIESTRPFEALLGEYRPEVVASYFATVLLNLDGTGVEPMFLYGLIPDLAAQPVFAQLTRLLRQWGYAFVAGPQEMRAGYRSLIATADSEPRTTLAALVLSRAHASSGDRTPNDMPRRQR